MSRGREDEGEEDYGAAVQSATALGGGDAGDVVVHLEVALRARLRVDPNALEDEFVACPADIAYLGAVHAAAIGEQLRARGKAKQMRGLVFIETRRALIAEHGAGRGGVTEELIKSTVEQDPRVQEADDDEVTAEVALTRAKANFAAVMAKKDMLVQMGATMRAEMERDPAVATARRESRLHREGGR